MAYQLSFFCRSGEERGDEALDRLLDHLLETGGGLRGEWLGSYEDGVVAFRLGTGDSDGLGAVTDLLTLEVHVGVAEIAESVIAASPDDERGIWGCDLLAIVTLSGDNPDWALVHRIWASVVDLWRAVPWDESSGFEIAASGSTAELTSHQDAARSRRFPNTDAVDQSLARLAPTLSSSR
ncbi:hypothetical protein AB0F46_34995 [Streptomyces sp. NPDC026665]|uniref:hypothetical protein n=1 Tax=Streptomyces sp. NPDC026665 TaxID=3154798 RepID=UPI0033C8CE5E